MTLLEQKADLLTEILNITRDTTFVGDEDDPQRYVDLMEKRAAVFEKMYVIDSELEKSEGFDKDAELDNKIKLTVREIINLDKENDPYVKKAMNYLRGNIKTFKTGKNLNMGYTQYQAMGEGMRFDSKN